MGGVCGRRGLRVCWRCTPNEDGGGDEAAPSRNGSCAGSECELDGEGTGYFFVVISLALMASFLASIVPRSAGMNFTLMPATCFSY